MKNELQLTKGANLTLRVICVHGSPKKHNRGNEVNFRFEKNSIYREIELRLHRLQLLAL